VATFDIGQYVYYFFREVALESTWLCSSTYYSRVARICKNDRGGSQLLMLSSFTSFVKARLVCSLKDVSIYFDEIFDVKYRESNGGQFYALFMTNSGGKWGSAVCRYSLENIDHVFDTSAWVSQSTSSSAWTVTTDRPDIRPGQCVNNSLSLDATTLSTFRTHVLMSETVRQSSSFHSRRSAFTRLEVDDGTIVVLYLYLPDEAAVYRVSVNSDGSDSNLFSILRPFDDISNTRPLTVWNMLFHSTSSGRWVYMTSDLGVVQLDVDQCALYKTCTDCVVDPYCGWDPDSVTCATYRTGYLTTTNASSICRPHCSTRYNHAAVVPGMSLHLNCSSHCLDASTADVRWFFQAAGSTAWNELSPSSDANYVVTRDGGLVILMVNGTQHAGKFQCRVFPETSFVLAEHSVALSACEYGEDVRDVLINEYINYCRQFDNYLARYNQWRCMQDACVSSNCVPNASNCVTTPDK
jgi:hypothetical protein